MIDIKINNNINTTNFKIIDSNLYFNTYNFIHTFGYPLLNGDFYEYKLQINNNGYSIYCKKDDYLNIDSNCIWMLSGNGGDKDLIYDYIKSYCDTFISEFNF